MGYGMSGHLGISFQNSFGTLNSNSMHWFPLLNESITETIETIEQESIQSRFEAGEAYEGMRSVGGDIQFQMHPILIGKWMKAWCGTGSYTASIVASHYEHTFMPAQTDWDAKAAVPPMTIEIYRGVGSAFLYYDCLANNMTIEIAHGAITKATLSVIGAKVSHAAAQTPSYIPGSDYAFDQASVSFNGTANDNISGFSIALNNNLEGRGTLDLSKSFNRIKRSNYRSVELSGTMLFDDTTEYDNFRTSAHQRVVCTITGGDCGSGYKEAFVMDFPRVRHKEFPINIGGPGLMEVSFSSQARYSSGSGTSCKFTVVNTHPAY